MKRVRVPEPAGVNPAEISRALEAASVEKPTRVPLRNREGGRADARLYVLEAADGRRVEVYQFLNGSGWYVSGAKMAEGSELLQRVVDDYRALERLREGLVDRRDVTLSLLSGYLSRPSLDLLRKWGDDMKTGNTDSARGRQAGEWIVALVDEVDRLRTERRALKVRLSKPAPRK
jgi:hypothetical protein